MNELQTQAKQLPTTLGDLSKFVLIGREKLNAVRAEIRAIQKIGLAKEVHEQKLQEAQEIAEAVLDAEVKIGELTKDMEKSVGGRPSETTDSGVHSLPTKASQLEEIGISEKQKQRYETLARHPETVEKAKEDARAEGRIVTRSDVLNRIVVPKENKNPSMKELVETAKQEHTEFKQNNQETVVDFTEIQRDRQNQILVNDDTEIKIRKAIQAVGSLILVSDELIQEMAKSMNAEDKRSLTESLVGSIKRLTHIVNQIGG